MKKNTVGGLLLAVFLGAAMSANAQTPEQRAKITATYDAAKSDELHRYLKEKNASEKAEALRLAELNGWPVTMTKEDGTFIELMRVEDGNPIYYTTFNHGSAITSRVDKLNTGGSTGLNLDGQDMIIGEWDAGRVLTSHQDLVGRVTQMDGNPTPHEHATHVAGTLIGSGEGNAQAKGMAPEATLRAYDWNNDTTEMQVQANQGLLVSNHSYGMQAVNAQIWHFGAYIGASWEFDNIAYTYPYYQPVVAAGNDRNAEENFNSSKNGLDLLTGTSTAKNAVIVGAIYEISNPQIPLADDVVLAEFSSFGPTDDKRVKPDIATKGMAVTSTVPGDGNDEYASLQGTSMASPGVAGALLLLQQHYSIVHAGEDMEFMRSATLRALMSHTADDGNDTPGPDFRTGWGIMNAEAAAAVITNDNQDGTSFIEELTFEDGDTFTKQVVANGLEELKVTIAWTDPAGPTNNNNTVDNGPHALVNDLDLRVKNLDTGEEFMPWRMSTVIFSGNPSRNNNDRDNIEKIDLPLVDGEVPIPTAGTNFLITVTGDLNANYDEQDFSLIVTGVDVDGELGIDDVAMQGIKMWPNPANDVLNISLGELEADEVSVVIYDIQGRKVAQKSSFAGVAESMDISGLSAGVYMVEFAKGDAKSSKKLIKK